MAVLADAGGDDAGLVAVLRRGDGGVDGDDDAFELRRRRPAQLFDASAVPQRARRVVDDLGVQLLTAKARALVAANDALDKGRGQVGPVIVARPPRRHRIGVGHDGA